MINVVIICIIIISCGLLGGIANFFRFEQNVEFSSFNLKRSLLIGTVSAFTVPLFLQMVSSDLIAEAGSTPSKYFVLIGFCLIAAFFSNRFLQSVGERVIRDLEEVKKKTNDYKEIVEELAEDKTDNEESTVAVPTAEDIIPQIENPNMSALYKTFQNEKFKFRTISGLAKESSLDKSQVEGIISTLEGNKLVKRFKGKGGKNIYSMTEKGKTIINKFKT